MEVGNNKRREIMDIAFSEFAQHGFNFSIVEVAHLAGMKKQSLYNHIDSKDHLVRLIMVREIEEFFNDLPKAEDLERYSTVEEKLNYVFSALIHIYSDFNRLKFWRWMTLFNVSNMLEDIRQLILTHEKSFQMMVVGLFMEGVHNGEIDPVQAQLAPQMFVTLIQGMMDGMITFHGQINVEDYRDRMWQGFWYGVRLRNE